MRTTLEVGNPTVIDLNRMRRRVRRRRRSQGCTCRPVIVYRVHLGRLTIEDMHADDCPIVSGRCVTID